MGKYLFFLSVLPLLASFYFHAKGNSRYAIGLLVFAAACIRFAVAAMDPFLHDWDERFHALVAKNMMAYPFKPMLRIDPVLPYDYTAWCCNHIWVHKQPLFLWQMALSMKMFGVNELAMRLPSVLLSAGMVWCMYRIARIWSSNESIAYYAAALCAVAYFQIEMVSGKMSLDHNDIDFTAYVTASIWAFCEYTERKTLRWALLTGLFVGCAILVKWLTGLLVFGGWGLWIILDAEERRRMLAYRDLAVAAVVSAVIAAPWQIYIFKAFPRESAWEAEYNYKHISERLGAFTSGELTFHLNQWTEHYGILLAPFFLFGLLVFFTVPAFKSRLTLPMMAMLAVVFGFFSIIVQTKMPAFTYIICSIVLSIAAVGFYQALHPTTQSLRNGRWIIGLMLLVICLDTYKPWQILHERRASNESRNAKINNTNIFKSLQNDVPPGYLIFNCKSFEDVDLRFYQPYNAHHWYPEKAQFDSLLQAGYKIAAFQNHPGQDLPDYMANNPNLLIIKRALK